MMDMDWIDQLAALAVRQGFTVWQNDRGVWMFRKGVHTVTSAGTPATVAEWNALLGSLRAAGLNIPPPE